jgi:Na+/melibiose symporter-like transporter
VQALAAPFALLMDALTFLASALGLLAIRASERAPQRAGPCESRREMAEGLRTTFGTPLLRAGAAAAATHYRCWGAIEAVLVLYVVRELGLGAGTYALALAVGAAGGLIGALMAARLGRRLGVGPAIVACAAVCCGAPLLIPLLADGAAAVLPLAVALFLRGLGGALGGTLGLRPTLLVAAVGLSLAWPWLLFSPLRRVRSYDATTR